MSKKTTKIHPSHSHHLKKLNRVIGQLEGVKRMVEARRYCPDILIQTRAAASALKSVEVAILETHLMHCVSAAMNSTKNSDAKAKIDELTSLVRRF